MPDKSYLVKVPTVPGPPGVCWAPQPLDAGMAYCGRPEGHAGPHTWERERRATDRGRTRAAGVRRRLTRASRATHKP